MFQHDLHTCVTCTYGFKESDTEALKTLTVHNSFFINIIKTYKRKVMLLKICVRHGKIESISSVKAALYHQRLHHVATKND